MAGGSAWGILPITTMTATRCPNCGTLPPEGARFCPSCGRPLGFGDAVERKLATVLFADLAGSTELSTEMDAETLRGLLGEVYDQLSRAAEAYGGTVEKFIGDAVMAVFGVPVAHEDDPERAVRAAIVMRSRLAGLAERRGMEMGLRIGINTGLVVTGTSPGRLMVPRGRGPLGMTTREDPARAGRAQAGAARAGSARAGRARAGTALKRMALAGTALARTARLTAGGPSTCTAAWMPAVRSAGRPACPGPPGCPPVDSLQWCPPRPLRPGGPPVRSV